MKVRRQYSPRRNPVPKVSAGEFVSYDRQIRNLLNKINLSLADASELVLGHQRNYLNSLLNRDQQVGKCGHDPFRRTVHMLREHYKNMNAPFDTNNQPQPKPKARQVELEVNDYTRKPTPMERKLHGMEPVEDHEPPRPDAQKHVIRQRLERVKVCLAELYYRVDDVLETF